mmetsp:Transcript_90407/g.161068  ORF Transcript_90407/g.161068 Transcript_90407/m.161068 type:complete len:84 (+) Transcript_90407:346-597(+)
MSKIDVNGENQAEVWMHLTYAANTETKPTRWNFDTKFVVKCWDDEHQCAVTRVDGVNPVQALEMVEKHLDAMRTPGDADDDEF